jgi:hypothetical protein
VDVCAFQCIVSTSSGGHGRGRRASSWASAADSLQRKVEVVRPRHAHGLSQWPNGQRLQLSTMIVIRCWRTKPIAALFLARRTFLDICLFRSCRILFGSMPSTVSSQWLNARSYLGASRVLGWLSFVMAPLFLLLVHQVTISRVHRSPKGSISRRPVGGERIGPTSAGGRLIGRVLWIKWNSYIVTPTAEFLVECQRRLARAEVRDRRTGASQPVSRAA